MLSVSPTMGYIFCPGKVHTDENKDNKSSFLLSKFRESPWLVKVTDALFGEGNFIGPEEEMGNCQFIGVFLQVVLLGLCMMIVLLALSPILLIIIAARAVCARSQPQDPSSEANTPTSTSLSSDPDSMLDLASPLPDTIATTHGNSELKNDDLSTEGETLTSRSSPNGRDTLIDLSSIITIVAAQNISRSETSAPSEEAGLTSEPLPSEHNVTSGNEGSTPSSSSVQSGPTKKNEVRQPPAEEQMSLANYLSIFYFGQRS